MTKTREGKRYAHRVKVPDLQLTMAVLMPKETENEVYLHDTIDATELLKYLEKKNADRDHDHRITMFHCVIMAVTKMINERPKMNRYVKGWRYWEREEISTSFVVKRQFADGADEELLFYVAPLDHTIDKVSADIVGDVHQIRHKKHGSDNGVNGVMHTFAMLPRIIQVPFCGLIRLLDHFQLNLKGLTDGDPNYSTVLISNLGSIKCPAVYHHLNSYGTNSILLTIGTLHKERMVMEDGSEQIRDVVDIGATLDERIADGFYFAKSLKLVKYIFAHPEMLERPINEPSGFDY